MSFHYIFNAMKIQKKKESLEKGNQCFYNAMSGFIAFSKQWKY